MIHRRDVLRASAAAVLAGFALPAVADESAAADLRRLVNRLADRSRVTRPFLLRRFDAARLSARERVLYETLLPGADADASLARRAWGRNGAPYPVTHRNGSWRRAAELREGDRIRDAVRTVNQDTNLIEASARRGVVAPGFVIDATLPELRSAAARVHTANVTDGDTLVIAITRQVEVLETQRAAAPEQPGMWRLPDGDEFYIQALQLQLGAEIDPREAHRRALERCHDLRREADRLLRAQGLAHGSIAQRLKAFAALDRFQVRDRDAVVAGMNAQLEKVRALLPGVIDATAAGGIQKLDPARSHDGTRGTRVGANYLVDMQARRPTWSFASVVHHEHTPGHILQSRFNGGVPELQQRYSSGYSEGWAIYAETLADEIGAFEGDDAARIGFLQWMLFRTARVVGDTGMHVMRWSRERTIEQMYELQGESISFVTIEDDVARFAAQPGVSAAQGLAAMHLLELRERTRRAAGDRFTLLAFHDAALRAGPLSPPGLEQAMRAQFEL
ncbi:MAG: DUF885 domain-containing protein [Hyphomonadaceae bacterium]